MRTEEGVLAAVFVAGPFIVMSSSESEFVVVAALSVTTKEGTLRIYNFSLLIRPENSRLLKLKFYIPSFSFNLQKLPATLLTGQRIKDACDDGWWYYVLCSSSDADGDGSEQAPGHGKIAN